MSCVASGAAHAIGLPLWIVAWNHLTSYPEPHGVFAMKPLRSFGVATYAFVVVDSENLAFASVVVAWVTLPAMTTTRS